MKNTFSPINPASVERVDMSQYFKPNDPVYISRNMSGKMDGILSISSSCLCNPICKARHENGVSVCARCFASTTVSMRKSLRDHLTDNYKVLNERDLLPHELPRVCADVCRLESFGDLASVTHAKNFLRIAYANPWCLFVLWTKNPQFMEKALDDLGRPDNIKFIYSSFELNKPELDIVKRYPFFDHVFTVYTAKYIAENNVNINCGGRKCRECMHCYTRGTALEISEQLK